MPRKTNKVKTPLEALSDLEVVAGEAVALQHAGLEVPPDVWSALYQACLDAHAVLAKAEKEK